MGLVVFGVECRRCVSSLARLAQVRHERGRRWAKWFRISSGYCRVCTTFALQSDALQSEMFRQADSEKAEQRFLLCCWLGDPPQPDFATVGGGQNDVGALQRGEQGEGSHRRHGLGVSGIKRHIAVDTQGLPHAIAVTTAHGTDRDGALVAIDRCKANLERVESVLVDGGYTGQPFADGVMERIAATVQVVKRNQLHAFVVLPKRWIVERSFAWLKNAAGYGRTVNAS